MSARRLAKGAMYALLVALVVLGTAIAAQAQVTTGTLSGVVRAQSDNSPIPGATVTITHVPTNSTFMLSTDADGGFSLVNAKPGGPYTVKVAMDGFQTTEKTGYEVSLGQTTRVEISLALATVTEEITVTGTAEEFINPSRTGSASDLDQQQIQAYPTVRRNILLDGAKTNPYASIRAGDDNQKDITFAGRSSKYNNIQIDGSNYNDLFGLGESGGTPGGQTNAQPVQQDIVQELQVSVSPYDVRQGGFTGGTINAVTKSGTNDFHGSLYYAKRDPNYVGDGPFDAPVKNFDEKQYGATVGGPMIQDKLWFFAAYENNKRSEASGFSADGSTGQQFGKPADAARLESILQNKYGYNAGGLGDVPIDTNSKHYFARVDWNAAAGQQFLLRYNRVDATRDDVANRSTSVFRFPNATFSRDAKIDAYVAQLDSVFGSNMFNQARLGYQTLDDVRTPLSTFPSVEVGGTGPRRGELIAGTEQFSGLNKIEQNVLEIHDDFTLLRDAHTWTIGTHNEFFDIKNYFLASAFGYYYFPTLDDLDAGLATNYQISFTNGNDPFAPASDFGIHQFGLYAGDEWRAKDNLTVTYGLRADYATFSNDPAYNPAVDAAFGINTSDVPGGNLILSPRVGFNWDPNGKGEQQLRGGIGVFAGRTPYVWISNVYAGTGVATTALSTTTSTPSIPFNPDPLNQPHSGAGSVPTVDAIDPNFEFPQVLRTTLGYDRTLPWWNLRGTVEVLYSQTQQDIYYVNSNRVQTGTNPLDGRPTYSKITTSFGDVPTLTNTSKGQDTMVSLVLSRPATKDGFGFTAGYTYSDSNNAFDGGSSRAISNWQFHPTRGDIFHPEESTSSWENQDRYFLNATYHFGTGPVNHTIGLFYNAESGRPFSLLMGGDPNKDGFSTNDLLYVPSDPNQVILSGFTWEQFQTYLHSNGVNCTGCIVKRNGSVGPWTRRLDFHYGLELPIKVVNVELTGDLINVLNMFDKNNGVVRYVSFGTTTPIRTSVDAATGKTVYSQNFTNAITNPNSPYSTSDILSRWQARIGVRISF